MLNALLATLGATVLAVVCALLVGVALGGLALGFLEGSRLSARLVELRGALPTQIAAPLLDGWLHLPAPVTLGLLVGAHQGFAVSRWVRGLRLLEPTPGPDHARALRPRRWLGLSPPVRTTIALCAVHVVTLEALLSALQLPPFTVSLGSLMAQALAPAARFGAVVALCCLFVLLDQGAERWARSWVGPPAEASPP